MSRDRNPGRGERSRGTTRVDVDFGSSPSAPASPPVPAPPATPQLPANAAMLETVALGEGELQERSPRPASPMPYAPSAPPSPPRPQPSTVSHLVSHPNPAESAPYATPPRVKGEPAGTLPGATYEAGRAAPAFATAATPAPAPAQRLPFHLDGGDPAEDDAPTLVTPEPQHDSPRASSLGFYRGEAPLAGLLLRVDRRTAHPLVAGSNRVGSGPDRTVILDDPGVSASQCSIVCTAEATILQPHPDATAPTEVDGEETYLNVVLTPGARLRFGEAEYTVIRLDL